MSSTRRLIKRLVLGALAVLLILVSIAVVRALMVDSRQITADPAAALAFDVDAAAERLAQAVRIQTVTHTDQTRDDLQTFEALFTHLETSYPAAHRTLSRERIAGRNLLYTWAGSDPSLPPLLFLAHTDVVPAVNPSAWTHPPFSGLRADGFIWGRGTIDDKNGVLALLEAVEALIASGLTPKRTIMLAFGGDEETLGSGARAMAAHLKAKGVKPLLILDEGGIISDGIVPGVARQVALIGVAEKGYLSLSLIAKGQGGHSSMPPPMTAAGRIARAVSRLEANPFPMRIDGGSALFMAWMAPEMAFKERLAFRNQWLLTPIIKGIYSKKNSTAALLRTTTAVTMLSGGPKENVLPQQATAVVNFRILPGETRDTVEARVKMVIADAQIAIERRPMGGEPSPLSDPSKPGFKLLQKSLAQVVPDAIVTPYLTVGATDARAYVGLSDQVLRFGAVRLKSEDLGRLHGVDERIAEADYAQQIRLYAQLMRNAQ
ncbi:MAG: carboxypeptidase PM20D1 [Bradymonadia bacterium]|jgi:carboxypeptidase PM20D1